MAGINYLLHKKFGTRVSSIEKLSTENFVVNNLTNSIIFENEKQILSTITYNYYPINKFENEKYIIVLEGKIYNYKMNEVVDNFYNLTEKLLRDNNDSEFYRFLSQLDADLIGFIYEKQSERIVIFNDCLGRLPVYYYEDNEKFIFSRQVSYILKILDDNSLSKIGLAQSLLFGYALGNSTIYKDIKRFKPGTLLKINTEINSFIDIKYKTRNFEVKHKNYSDEKKYFDDVTDLFIEACGRRSTTKNILSLSGGLDSRIVAGGLRKSNTAFKSFTLNDPWKDGIEMGISEVKIAQDVANLCNSECSVLEGKPANGKILNELLDTKNGNNHLGFAYLLNYLHEVKKNSVDESTFFTGDGGDKLVKYQMPVKSLTNNEMLIDYLLKIHNIFTINDVASLTNISVDELREGINNLFNTYPENNLQYKYVHFVFNERVNNWLFEGEDRNRFYFWSVTPFYGSDFFDFSMKIPDKLKIRNRLYREMLFRLDPKLLEIKYANIHWPINSYKAKSYAYLKDKYNSLPQNIRDNFKKIVKKEKDISDQHFELKNKIYSQFNNTPEIKNYLNIKAVENLGNTSPDQLKMLFNVTSIIEYYYSEKSIIDKNLDKEFSFR